MTHSVWASKEVQTNKDLESGIWSNHAPGVRTSQREKFGEKNSKAPPLKNQNIEVYQGYMGEYLRGTHPKKHSAHRPNAPHGLPHPEKHVDVGLVSHSELSFRKRALFFRHLHFIAIMGIDPKGTANKEPVTRTQGPGSTEGRAVGQISRTLPEWLCKKSSDPNPFDQKVLLATFFHYQSHPRSVAG